MQNAEPAYSTRLGKCICGDSLDLIPKLTDESVDLAFTSPPFALQRKKEYGNPDQGDYVEWLATFAKALLPKLKETGSFVIDIGGAYQKGIPSRSLYPFKTLIKFCDELGYHLAEDFYWFNPSKLPSPIEWVNKRKLRAKDSVNTVWWLSKTAWPKADISTVLTEYSPRMKQLLQDPTGFYSPKLRPSGHDIGAGFARNNGGAIPSNLLSIPNSESNGAYLGTCKALGLVGHPARFPGKLPEFFIRMLTSPGDLVLDFFSGSNTTGMVAEAEGRRWLSFELDREYTAASVFRFLGDKPSPEIAKDIFARVLAGEHVDLSAFRAQSELFEGGETGPRAVSVQGKS